MVTVLIATACVRLSHSWKTQCFVVMFDLIFPKIYLIIKDSFYVENPKFDFACIGTAVLPFVLCFITSVNFRNNERESRLINQIAFNFNMQENQSKALDKLPEAVIIADH